MVIFKGAAYQSQLGRGQPTEGFVIIYSSLKKLEFKSKYFTSIGYQKKGWTSGEISADWIKKFDKETKNKVEDGEYQLLLVDGHNSHHTVDFLLYAREHLIVVLCLCYIPHFTHIYQGLDVVIFSPLKKYIGEERDKLLREHAAAMDKNNFLAIYSKAHVRALTADNIKSAFKKTGMCSASRSGPVPVLSPSGDRTGPRKLQKSRTTDQDRKKPQKTGPNRLRPVL
jgi:hypothetical protein